MGIKGFIGLSTVDFPGNLASVVFVGGCNLRCPFCYNHILVLPEELGKTPDIEPSIIIEDIRRRAERNFITGVVITGGEPSLWTELPGFVRDILRIPLLVKVDTNGTRPDLLESISKERIYLAVDLKGGDDFYRQFGYSLDDIKETVGLFTGSSSFVEIRIPLLRENVSRERMEEFLPILRKVNLVALQYLIPARTLDPSFKRPEIEQAEIDEVLSFLKERGVERIEIRNSSFKDNTLIV